MTDKDPKDMTAAELLREADSNPCSMCHLVMTGDESCATTGCASWAYRLADKIDAEIVKAYSEKLNTCAMRWAKANGWPDFRDGEDFGAWLARCFIPRPRFEDGEPVQFGELVSSNLFGAVKVSAIEFTEDGTHVKDEPDGDWSTSLEVTTSRLKRPAPEVLLGDGKPVSKGETVYVIESGIERTARDFGTKLCEGMDGWDGSPWVMFDNDSWMHARDLTHEHPVLGADGLPVKVGDAMWSLSGAGPLTVTSLHTDDPTPDGGDSPWADLDDDGLYSWIYAGSLTHTPPDTQERIDSDAAKVACNYFRNDGNYCEGCPVYDHKGLRCNEAMILDLLRRQRELDARMGGAE